MNSQNLANSIQIICRVNSLCMDMMRLPLKLAMELVYWYCVYSGTFQVLLQTCLMFQVRRATGWRPIKSTTQNTPPHLYSTSTFAQLP